MVNGVWWCFITLCAPELEIKLLEALIFLLGSEAGKSGIIGNLSALLRIRFLYFGASSSG